ncbi:uncharacterized protein LOC113445143 [Pseudonaja textilis]|uniref:uncharacterized protein LOC113445143 n=1 Tax=Pseudonaja textilis TaxID=8673 RepID=UPI000EA944E0|nr:uncharacterized protein LOC113445143 [Pseudonaja textilis]
MQSNGLETSEFEHLLAEIGLSTLLALALFVVLKLSVDSMRRSRAKVSVLVVGAGPVGLTAALVAVHSGKVLKLTLLDMCPRATLLCRSQQIALDPHSVRFLLGLGVDFGNLEGCWDKGHFFTKLGIFQEQLLSILEQYTRQVALRILLGTKFSIELLKKDLVSDWPKIIVLADGTCGESSVILGINPEYTVESCNAYGANAVMERPDQRQVPTPEIRVHNLYFDLSAYGMDKLAIKTEFPKTAFHLKIHGTFRNRCLALACPASDSKIIKFLHHTLNSTIMKSIFQQSFNAYKMDIEPRIGEPMLHGIRCSHRLFEIVLSHRRVTTAFLVEDNTVVTVEGEAARMLNFDTGCGVNLGLKGLESMEELIYKVATAVDQQDIFKALAAKIQHSRQVVEDFKQNGLSATMFE